MAPHVVVRNIDRAPAEVISGLGETGVATVHEAYGKRGLMDPGIRPIQWDTPVAGSAVTVECGPGDNIMIHAAIEVLQPGDIMVVTTTAPSTHGMFGDLLATSVMARGAVGLVIDAGVRDISTLRQMGFPVWSRAIHAEGTAKDVAGSVNLPITCAGQAVSPGDVVVADDDGVVVVERADAASVLDKARERLAKEEDTRSRLESGEMGLDVYGLRVKLVDLGVRWVDDADEI